MTFHGTTMGILEGFKLISVVIIRFNDAHFICRGYLRSVVFQEQFKGFQETSNNFKDVSRGVTVA